VSQGRVSYEQGVNLERSKKEKKKEKKGGAWQFINYKTSHKCRRFNHLWNRHITLNWFSSLLGKFCTRVFTPAERLLKIFSPFVSI